MFTGIIYNVLDDDDARGDANRNDSSLADALIDPMIALAWELSASISRRKIKKQNFKKHPANKGRKKRGD